MKATLFKESKDVQKKKGAVVGTDEDDPLSRYFDGMGTATAGILIHRHFDDDVFEKYGLTELKNAGRYYIARIVAADGKLIDEVLIDKQSGTIKSLHLKARTNV